MDLLLIVSHPEAGSILRPLAEACGRAGTRWAAFFTNDGVRTLGDATTVAALATAASAVACTDSWEQHMAGSDCPVTLGSQTGNSELVGEAARIVSL